MNHCQACAVICVMEEAHSNNIERDSCPRNRSTNAETVFSSEYFDSVDEFMALLECLPDRRLAYVLSQLTMLLFTSFVSCYWSLALKHLIMQSVINQCCHTHTHTHTHSHSVHPPYSVCWCIVRLWTWKHVSMYSNGMCIVFVWFAGQVYMYEYIIQCNE